MRRRIVLLAAATALVAVTLLAIPLGALIGRNYLHNQRIELQQLATTAAAQTRGDLTAIAVPASAGATAQLTTYDQTGTRITGSGPTVAPALVRAALAGHLAEATTSDRIVVAAPISDGDQITAVLLLTASLDAVHQRTTRAWLALAGMGVAATLLAALGAALFSRRLTRPIDALCTVAARVGDGDLSVRAAPSGVRELDTLAGTLNTTVGRVDTLLGRERAFSAEVSHQLRTPLGALRLELDAAASALALHRGAPGSAAADRDVEATESAITRARQAADRLEATISDVSALARDLPTSHRVAVADIIDATNRHWRGPLAAAGRPLRVIVDPDAPAGLCISAAAATQILDVLLDNAQLHGRGAITVHVSAVGNDFAAVTVSDEGPQLELEAWQLFDNHHQPGQAGDSLTHRHGLGLPYARRLAQAEGARLALASGDVPAFQLVTGRAPRA